MIIHGFCWYGWYISSKLDVLSELNFTSATTPIICNGILSREFCNVFPMGSWCGK